jgi:hypothetical protein
MSYAFGAAARRNAGPADLFAVEVEKIEQKEHQTGGVAAVRCGLDHAERGDAVGVHAAQLPFEISVVGPEREHGRGDRRIFVRLGEPGARQHPHRAAVEPCVHAVAVELDFVEPLRPLRRRVDELGQLPADPLR